MVLGDLRKKTGPKFRVFQNFNYKKEKKVAPWKIYTMNILPLINIIIFKLYKKNYSSRNYICLNTGQVLWTVRYK